MTIRIEHVFIVLFGGFFLLMYYTLQDEEKRPSSLSKLLNSQMKWIGYTLVVIGLALVLMDIF